MAERKSDEGNRTRQRMLAIIDYLKECTDEDHPATTLDLLEHLSNRNLPTNRKTLRTDLQYLMESESLDIVEIRSNPNRYFYGDREFELPELKLLADAVSSSRFITAKKSAQLIEKLGRFQSEHRRMSLQRHVISADSVKPLNENIYYIVDQINEAINGSNQIRFQYEEYTATKEKVLRGDGETYYLSPYTLYWSDDFYYVIGWSEKHNNVSSFRVDRMANVAITEEASIEPPEDWNVEDYSRKVFEMFTGETTYVTLECENELMKYVVDHFGEDVHTKVIDDTHFVVSTEVSISPNFYSWIFRFAGRIRITAPTEVHDEYIEMAKKVVES